MSGMSLIKKHSSQGGALLSALLFMAVIGFTVLGMMSLSDFIEKSYTTTQNRTRYIDLVNFLRAKFEDPQICSTLLTGRDITSSLTTNGQSLLPLAMSMAHVSGPITPNFQTPMGIKITDIRLKTNPATIRNNIRRDLPGSPEFLASEAEVTILTDKGRPGLAISNNANLTIEIVVVYRNSAGVNTLDSCFSRNGGAALCISSGGAYNAFTLSPNKTRCEPDESCFVADQGLVTSPALCLPPYTPTAIAQNLYYCQWCNQNSHLSP